MPYPLLHAAGLVANARGAVAECRGTQRADELASRRASSLASVHMTSSKLAWSLALLGLSGCSGMQRPAPIADHSEDAGDASRFVRDAPEEGTCLMTSVESSATITTSAGAIHGTLLLPPGCGPWPVALIIAGSGPTDRNGNSLPSLVTDAYHELADHLADRHIASLRYDKRGVGESAPSAPREMDLRFETYADDAASWVAQLKDDPRFNAVVVIGHSEGSLLGMLAIEKQPVQAFISLAGVGRPANAVLREQLAKQLNGVLLTQANQILDSLEMGKETFDIPAQLSSLFRLSVQPYLISWFRYDASKEIAKLSLPTLLAQGTTDIQVDVADANLLAKARPDATLLLVDGMCHTLKMATSDPASQQAAYTNPKLPLAPPLVEGLDRFLQTNGLSSL
jgi:pimeloyl-ACP methyl ester carboxylesterase